MANLTFNGFPALRAQLPGLIQDRINKLAEEFRRALIAAIDTGQYGLGTDTGTYIEAIFIQTPFGSDYDERVRAAGQAYLNNPSMWAEPVQEKVDPDAYSQRHFDERVAPEEPLPVERGVAIARVATFWAVAHFWEFGHNNRFTERHEQRPVFGPEADQFMERFAAGFENLLEGVRL